MLHPDLKSFISKESVRLKQSFPMDDAQEILARTVKLSEELGELSSNVLSHLSYQRHDKPKITTSDLSHEFADVIITALLLAESLDIDISKALMEKTKKIDERYA